MPSIGDNTFVFLSTMWWQERKNPEGLIKAYLSEFNKDNDDVILILIALSYNPNWVASQINNIKSQVRKMSLHPRIGLTSHTLEGNTLSSLMNKCDSYVSLHKGEGFGIAFLSERERRVRNLKRMKRNEVSRCILNAI